MEREPQARILFLGSDRPIERSILSSTPFEHLVLPVPYGSDLRRRPVQLVRHLMAACRAAGRVMRSARPTAVIGCGGFASVAPVVAARRLDVPCLLLEQNVIPGRATRWLSRLGGTVCLTYRESAVRLPRSARAIVTGNPVRRQIAALAGDRPRGESQTLLVLGGSQGARRINDLMLRAATVCRPLREEWRIVHQTGAADEERVRHAYAALGIEASVSAFFADAADLYRQAGAVVSRAGGTTLAELACAGLPALLIPYPQAADDHQWHNAEWFASAGAAVRCDDTGDGLSMSSRFEDLLGSLLQDADRRTRMAKAMSRLARPQATQEVLAVIDGLIGTEPGG